MRVSVVIPAYNSEKTLEKSIASVRQSTFKNFELLVVDDGSTDSTAKIASIHADRVIRHGVNRGLAESRQTGLNQAKSEIVVYLDSDTLLRSDALDVIQRHFKSSSDTNAVTGCLAVEHPHNNLCSQYKNLYWHYVWKDLPETVNSICGGIFAIKKPGIPFDVESGHWCEDQRYARKLIKNGKKIVFLKKLQVIHLHSYTFRSLIKDEFSGCFAMAELLSSGEDQKFFGKKSSNNNAGVIFLTPALLLSAGILFLIHKQWYWIIVGVLVWVFLNKEWLRFLLNEKGLRFCLLLIPLTVIIHVVKIAGALCGVIFLIAQKLKNQT